MRAILLAVVLSAACVQAQETPADQKILAAPGGRFAFGQINRMARDQFMLDTQTGRLWRMVENKSGATVLEPIAYVAIQGTQLLEPVSAAVEYEMADKKRAAEAAQEPPKK